MKGEIIMSNYTFAPREYKDLTAYAHVSVSVNYVVAINIYVFNAEAESVLDYSRRLITDDALVDVVEQEFTEAFQQAVRKQKESDDDNA